MDSLFNAVVQLFKQEYCVAEICRKLKLSHNKVRKILVTTNCISTPESEMFHSGMTVGEIADVTGKSRKAVIDALPYIKGHYFAENPSQNALNIRKYKEKKKKLNGLNAPCRPDGKQG